MPGNGDDCSQEDEVKVFCNEEDAEDTEKHAVERNLLEEKDAIVCVADHEDNKSAPTTSSSSGPVPSSTTTTKTPSSTASQSAGERRVPNGTLPVKTENMFKPGAGAFFDPCTSMGMANPLMYMQGFPYGTGGLYLGNRLPFPTGPHPPAAFGYFPGFTPGAGVGDFGIGGPPPAHIGINPVVLDKTGVRSPYFPFPGPQFPSFYSPADYWSSMAALHSGLLSSPSAASFSRLSPAGLPIFPSSPATALSPLQSPGGTQIGAMMMPPPLQTPSDGAPGSARPGSTSSSTSSTTPLPSCNLSSQTGSNLVQSGSNGFRSSAAYRNPLESIAQVKLPNPTSSLTSVASGVLQSPLAGILHHPIASRGVHHHHSHTNGSHFELIRPLPVENGHSKSSGHGHNNNNGHLGSPNHSPKRSRAEHIKKPLNAFMLYMREHRPEVMKEVGLQERQSAEINRLLGRKWHSLAREEQQKYYEMAKQERAEHQKKYPGWSARDNYAIHKKRKRKRDKAQGMDNNNELKKCRARFGLSQQDRWCKHCRRKKKCLRFKEGDGDDVITNSPPAQVSSTTHFLGGPPSVDGASSSATSSSGDHSGISAHHVPGLKRQKLDSLDSLGGSDARSPYSSHVTSTTNHLGGPGSAENPASMASNSSGGGMLDDAMSSGDEDAVDDVLDPDLMSDDDEGDVPGISGEEDEMSSEDEEEGMLGCGPGGAPPDADLRKALNGHVKTKLSHHHHHRKATAHASVANGTGTAPTTNGVGPAPAPPPLGTTIHPANGPLSLALATTNGLSAPAFLGVTKMERNASPMPALVVTK